MAVSPVDFNPQRLGSSFYLILNDIFVLTAVPFDGFPRSSIGLSDPHRTWAQISLRDAVNARIYDPFSEGGDNYLGSLNVEVSFAGRKSSTEQLDQDELANIFVQNFKNQILSPGQRIVMDYKSIPLLFVVQTVTLVDLAMEKISTAEPTTAPNARGIVVPTSQMNFYKDAKSEVNLKASKRRPAANAILAPSFKFEEMGIGGLDGEFATIFRRAFQSRIFPPGLIQQLGIQHVRGLLLYGPPGTGKTLMARKIGQMLNAREPKIVNGPEVLNKFVGQSEENIRKLFADAEKEYKEKGDESGLHIIIFDELDAVCRQRGSGSAGGTGVGDSVVNQLLSKLDGVDQLNNILLIGMTNRKDMIDDALLRPGRLEVHVEVSLPDEAGRLQIFKIHTASMVKNSHLDPDVDLRELAARSKNFSGAEVNGLVRSATSWALNRHVKDNTMVANSDIDLVAINKSDFDRAFKEIKPAFGVSEDELQDCLSQGGIMHYSPYIQNILEQASLIVKQVRNHPLTRLYTGILHGPPGSGKTALAAKIALDSGYPFIRLLTPKSLVGLSEAMKISHIQSIFEDAYKSTLSVIVIDNIERIIGWSGIGPRFENGVVQALMILLKQRPPMGRRLLCLGTTSSRSVLQQLDLFEHFTRDIAVPSVNTYDELANVMQESGAFDEQSMRQAMHELQENKHNSRVGVGVKRVLQDIGTAQENPVDMASEFARAMNKSMAENNMSMGEYS